MTHFEILSIQKWISHLKYIMQDGNFKTVKLTNAIHVNVYKLHKHNIE